MKFNRIIPLLICSSLILFYFIIIIKNSVNIPNGDDFYCLLLFTQDFQDAASWIERFRLITEQWVEHRIVYSRFTALLSYWLTGQVNFITIIFIGNLTLVGFTVIFWKLLKKTGLSMYYLIPVVLILFSPVMYEANVWAGASTVYMPVCFLGIFTVYLLAKNTQIDFALAAATALLATFSFGNGMFAFVAGLMVLIFQKRYHRAGAWTILSVSAILLYFRNFKALSGTKAFDITTHFQKPAYLFYNFFAFIGGIVDYAENVNQPVATANIPAILLGFGLTAIVSYGMYYFVFKTNTSDNIDKLKISWLGIVVFMGITALTMAYSRTSGESMNTLSSRYKIYSMIIFILIYWWGLMVYKRKAVIGWFFGCVSLVLLVFNYYTNYQKLTNYKSFFLSGLYNYNVNKQWVIYRHTSYFEGASKILSDSIKRNPKPVYFFNDVFPQLNQQSLMTARTISNIKITENNNYLGGKENGLSLHSDDYPTVSNNFQGIYLVVYNDKNIFLFVANPARNGRFNIFTKGEYFKKGFSFAENFGQSLEKGAQYKLAIFCPTDVEQIRLINYEITG